MDQGNLQVTLLREITVNLDINLSDSFFTILTSWMYHQAQRMLGTYQSVARLNLLFCFYVPSLQSIFESVGIYKQPFLESLHLTFHQDKIWRRPKLFM